MGYQTIATVTSLTELESVVSNYELQTGDRLRLKMEVQSPFEYIFDVAGAELAFKPFMPSGMTLIDVWGESGAGYIEMEANSPWLAAVLAFVAKNWLGIVISGVLLAGIVLTITVMLKVNESDPNFTTALAIGAAVLVAIVGVNMLNQEKKKNGY